MKPTLYLHCGMYKTGSSFLQTMFVRNRDLLSKAGIHYPKSEQELEMHRGQITAGNGIHLSDMLSRGLADVVKLLSEDLIESEKMGLNNVLYSSEILFHEFTKNGAVDKLKNASEQAGFGEIRALLYFRDPISHALSTYKHRAKYGGHKDFNKWLETKYEIFELVEAFLNYSANSDIRWTCRKYKSDSAYMIDSAFVGWLGAALPVIPDDDRVNRSLQLNEIRVLQTLRKQYPGSEDFLRKALLTLNAVDKENEQGLKDEYSYLIARHWNKNRSMLDDLNGLLNESEQLAIGSYDKPEQRTPFIVLSEKQLTGVADGFDKYLKSHKLSNRLFSFGERGLNKIKRKIVASKISYKFLKQ